MISFFRKLYWQARRRNKEAELNAELQFHMEEEAEEREHSGLEAGEAIWAARRDLGNLTALREQTRAVWSWAWIEQLLQDLRYAARTSLRNPAFTLLAAISLALGIGANTAIYSFMDALLMRFLPVPDAKTLVALNWHVAASTDLNSSVVHDVSGQIFDDPRTGKTSAIFPYPAFELLSKNDVLSVLFAYHPARKLNLVVQGQAEVAGGEYVSGAYFAGLGLVPAAGRLIAGGDDRIGAPAVVVLSYAFARDRFGNAANAAGTTVLINNIPFTAIGVAPPGFFGVDPAKAPDFYIPMYADLLLNPIRDSKARPDAHYLDEHYYWVEMMGRLKPGVTMARAQAALGSAFEQWAASTATNGEEKKNPLRFLLKDGARGLDNLRRRYSQPLLVLLGLVGLILAIACANIANLLLARATARRREMAVRLSIGAGRWRVVRQLLTESLLLASIGGLAGILCAVWGIRLLSLLLASGTNTVPVQAAVNWRVLAAASALTILTGLVCGLAPALQAVRVDLIPGLKESRTGEPRAHSGRRFGAGRLLLVSQIAISLLLLVTAGLFVRTLSNLQSLETGFRRENLLLFTVNARQAGHRDPEILTFYRDLGARLTAIPGVLSATVANSPLIGDGAWGWPVVPLGKPRPEKAPSGHGSGMDSVATRVLSTGPGFFTTMGIPLLAGRQFDARDSLGSPPVAIVNQAWVKANLDGRNPVGQQIVSFGFWSNQRRQMQIIGVAANTRYDNLTGTFPPIVYLPFEQNLGVPAEEMTFFMRTAGDPKAYTSAIRDIVHRADPRIPVTNLETQAEQIDTQMSSERLFARLCTGFAVLALLIACVGLYGSMSYSVARRTREIGIRMALGAQQRTVLWMVLREILILSLVGLAISVPASLGAARLIASLLYGVKPDDPATLAAAVAILVSAAFAAGYLPARKASRIDPMGAVRDE